MDGTEDRDLASDAVDVWHNPSCSKCRTATAALDEAGVAYRLRPYLDQPPTAEELVDVLARLGTQPWEICRTEEPAAVALGIADWPRDADSVARWVAAMVANPVLIQRPILLLGDGSAMVARGPEALDEAIGRTSEPPGELVFLVPVTGL